METELLEDAKKEIGFVRIIIGNAKTGSSGVKAPTKSISLVGITVDRIYKFIIKAVKEGELK